MRILLIVSSARIGGAERHVAALARGLADRGREVQVLCTPGGWLGGYLRSEGIAVAESRMRGAKGGFETASLLRRLVRGFRPSVVHSHLTGAAYYATLAGMIGHVPTLASVHNVTGAAYRLARRSRTGVGKRRVAIPRNTDWAFHLLARRGGTLIAVSDFVRGLLVEDGIPEERIRVIYNGTEFADLDVPAPDASVRSELGIPRESMLVATVGRVCPQKGQLLALESFAKLPRELLGSTGLLFVGAVAPSFSPVIEQSVRSCGLEGKVILAGVREDVRRVLSTVDVVIHPSQAEACPLAVLEAMAVGKPVIATRVGGIVNVVTDGKDGVLVERAAEDMSLVLTRLLGDEEERRRLGAEARRTAAQRFTLSRMVADHEELYDAVCRPR